MVRPLVVGALVVLTSVSLRAQAPATAAVTYRAMLDKYCVTCHNQRLKTGELALDTIDTANLTANPDVLDVALGKTAPGTTATVHESTASLLRELTAGAGTPKQALQ